MEKKKAVLVTGGLGYIATHLIHQLLLAGRDVVAIYSRTPTPQENIVLTFLAKTALLNKVLFFPLKGELVNVFNYQLEIETVIHLAAHKPTTRSGSVIFEENTRWISVMLPVMRKHNVKNLIFASSGSIYESSDTPVNETSQVYPINIYALSKLAAEQTLLKDAKGLYVTVLRYFNPIGGDIKSQTNCIEATIREYGPSDVIDVYTDLQGKYHDGFVRDYIHMSDLTYGTILALNKLEQQSQPYSVFNIGTGVGTSTGELIRLYEAKNNTKYKTRLEVLLPGTMPECQIADIQLARDVLDFDPKPISEYFHAGQSN